MALRHTALAVNTEAELALATSSYVLWKAVFVGMSSAVLVCAWCMSESRWRTRLIAACFAWICFVEAYLFMSCAWAYPPVPAAWFTEMRSPTLFLQSSMTAQERIYLRALDSVSKPRAWESGFPYLAARYKVQNIAGYEPLISRRYSRALGGVWLDGVRKLADRRWKYRRFT